MTGYYGYSMSNNAVLAYEWNEKPLSKWTKADILSTIQDEIEENEIDVNFNIELLKKLPLRDLKTLCLYQSSWHHTSKFYNITDFYSVSIDNLEDLNDETILGYLKAKNEPNAQVLEKRRRAQYLVWSGRRHPKPTIVEVEGIHKGNWFYLENGRKKFVNSNGFKFID